MPGRTSIQGIPITPAGIHVANPAFDVTLAHFITGIITEKGIICEPFEKGIRGNRLAI